MVQHWRSEGFNVIVCASSAAAAELISGVTVHSAFKLNPKSGAVMRSTLCDAAYSDHFMTIFKCDIIIIDEISMLTSGALGGVNSASTFAKNMGTALHGRSFGGCSVIVVGDLFQLPAVESAYREQQVYLAEVWGEFKLLELSENCRSVEDQDLARIQHKIREGPDELTPEEWALLESRLCSNHCPPGDLIDFQDDQEIHKSSEVVSQHVCHCPFREGAMCLAARRNKVDNIVAAWAAKEQADNPGLEVVVVTANDLDAQRVAVSYAPAVDSLNRACRGLRSSIPLFVGMEVVLTINKSQKRGFINGRIGVIEELHRDIAENVIAVLVRDKQGRLHTVVRHQSEEINTGIGKCVRRMFPIVPAICVTVHRVQGVTHENDLHILFNDGKRSAWLVKSPLPAAPSPPFVFSAEFFEYGQGYVALTRIRRLAQLHLWCLSRAAFTVQPAVKSEYARLRAPRNALTEELILANKSNWKRQKAHLLPAVLAAAHAAAAAPAAAAGGGVGGAAVPTLEHVALPVRAATAAAADAFFVSPLPLLAHTIAPIRPTTSDTSTTTSTASQLQRALPPGAYYPGGPSKGKGKRRPDQYYESDENESD
jgi:ATP-dependent DNA helicase PIF1